VPGGPGFGAAGDRLHIPARGLCASLAATWRAVTHDLFDSYRPERHYMRGPGPKWRAKQALSGQYAYGAAGA
jgi:hypothetical protein